ncbi:hypothetical protein K4K56_002460 [Colletotrichum sp. SAR 10_98]|nr:hypothetical protein K4K56_002460 [Colletotrichum sp. SAR 10_98]
MSVDANGNAIPPDYVPKAVGETLDVGNLANPAQGMKNPGLRPQEASKSSSNMAPDQTPQPSSTIKQPRSKSAAPKVPSSTTNGGGSITSSKRPGLKARGKSHISMHEIVRKVRNHFSSNSRRQTGSSEASARPAPTAQKTPADDIETASVCRRGFCQYILNDGEVQDVVEIVVHEMSKHGVGPVDKDQGAALQPGEEVPRQVVRKPSCLMNALEPHVSDVAEPATTISLPETAFFARSQSDGQIRARVRSSKVSMTTILSKDNVTDIRWTADDAKPENESQGDAKDGPTGKSDTESSAEAGSAAKLKTEGDQEQPKGTKAAAQKIENTENNEAGDVPSTTETPAAGPRLHEISDCDMDDLSDYAIDNQPTTNPPPAEISTTKDVDTKSSDAISQELNKSDTEAKTPDAVEPELDSKEELPGAAQADESPLKQNGHDDAEREGLKRASIPDGSTSKEVDVTSTEAVNPSPQEVDSAPAGPDPNKPDAKDDDIKVPDADQRDSQQLDVSRSDGELAKSKTLKSRFLETFLKPSNDTAADGASGESEIPREASLQKENSKSSIANGLDDQQDVTSFHPLGKRRGTHEWQSPPYGAIPEEQETDDMYHLGVDARPGGAVPATDSNVSRPDPTTRYNFGLFNRNVFGEGTYDATLKPGRRVSEASIMAIGAAAPRSADKVLYRSRSAHFADVSNSDPGFLQKLTRKLSSVFQTPPQTPVMRAPAPSLETKAEAQRRSICSEDNAPQRIDAVTSLKGLMGSGGR